MNAAKINFKVASEMHGLKIFFRFNSKPPISSEKGGSYGWLTLPLSFKGKEITIEERSGIYGGPYIPSTGAPHVLGLCSIGSFSYSYSPLPNGIKIGRYCSIAKGLTFLDSHHPTNILTTSAVTFRPNNLLWKDLLEQTGSPVDKNWHIYANKAFPSVGHDVWICKNVTLSMGIKIGNGSIIAANSVVTKDVPEYSVVGGNPAKVIKYRFDDDVIAALKKLDWWNHDPSKILHVASKKPVTDVLSAIKSIKESGSTYRPKTLIISKNEIILATAQGCRRIDSE